MGLSNVPWELSQYPMCPGNRSIQCALGMTGNETIQCALGMGLANQCALGMGLSNVPWELGQTNVPWEWDYPMCPGNGTTL